MLFYVMFIRLYNVLWSQFGQKREFKWTAWTLLNQSKSSE
jgi:hypothetical protein